MAYDPTLRIPKGTALTWEELDANFIDLQTELANLAVIVATTDTYVSQATFTGGQLKLTLNSGFNTSVTLDGRYLPLSGGTMIGPITLPGDPTVGLHAASKQYVDNLVGASSYDSNTFLADLNTTSITELLDVDTSNTIPGQILAWDGSNWTPVDQTQDTDTFVTDVVFSNATGDLTVTLSDSTAITTSLENRYVPYSGGIMSGFLTQFADPVLGRHTATKDYVDNSIAAITDVRINGISFDSNTGVLTASSSDSNVYITPLDGRYVELDGDTMTGMLTLSADPTANLHAATKQYVDSIGVSSLNDLLDVDILTYSYSNGMVLTYDSATQLWIPKDVDVIIDAPHVGGLNISGIFTLNAASGYRSWSINMTGNINPQFTSPTTPGYEYSINVRITGNGGTITWPATVQWANGNRPNDPSSGETAMYIFSTVDNGASWQGSFVGLF